MYCSWHAGGYQGRPKTGLFNVTLGSSKVVLDSITSVTVPKAQEREAITRFGLGKAVKVERRGEVNFIVQRIRDSSLIRYIVNWAKLSSIFPVHLTTACCSVEYAGTVGSRYDPERFGILNAVGSLRQSDLLLVEGTVTAKMAQRVRVIYDQMPDPKWVMAMGACAISGGLYAKDSYNVIQGIDDIVPVDVYVPGCPPRPETLIQGFVLLRDKMLNERL